jgi:hypothetical protein
MVGPWLFFVHLSCLSDPQFDEYTIYLCLLQSPLSAYNPPPFFLFATLTCVPYQGRSQGGRGLAPLMLQETTNLHCENKKINTKSVKLVDFNLKFGNLALLCLIGPQFLNPGYAPVLTQM